MQVTMSNYRSLLPERLWKKFLGLVSYCESRPGTMIVFEKGNVHTASVYQDDSGDDDE